MNPPLPLPLARSAWIRQEMASRVLTAVAACSVVVLALAPTVPAAPLRVCADPDNLPFTSSNPNERGLYLELAELIAARPGASMADSWSSGWVRMAMFTSRLSAR